MGHYNSKVTAPAQTFTPQVEVINEKQSSQFGDVKVVKDTKTGQEMYVKRVVTHDPVSHNTQLAYYHNRVQNPHPNLVNVVGYTSEEKTAFCSEKYTINVYVDSLFNNMSDELKKYIKNDSPMSEIDLQLICENMITILAEFQRRELSHGDVCPANIFITEEAYKLCDPTFNGQQTANGVSRYVLTGVKSLLAPELAKQIPTQDCEIKTNKYKADVFALGATMLSLASLTDSEDIYDYEHGAIDYKLLDARIKKAADIYSPTFINLLRELLTVDEAKRPDFLHLVDKLNISERLRNYNAVNPISSYAKVPYVKIAANLNSANNSPVKVTDHSFSTQDSPYKSVQKSF